MNDELMNIDAWQQTGMNTGRLRGCANRLRQFMPTIHVADADPKASVPASAVKEAISMLAVAAEHIDRQDGATERPAIVQMHVMPANEAEDALLLGLDAYSHVWSYNWVRGAWEPWKR